MVANAGMVEQACQFVRIEQPFGEVERFFRPLLGLLKLAFLNWIFDWMQERFGFGRGASCTGCGCGLILLLLFLVLAFSVITDTNWLQIGF